MEKIESLVNEILDTEWWSMQEFIKRIPKGEKKYQNEILRLIDKVILNPEYKRLSILLLIAEQDGLSKEYLPVFCKLLDCDWHGSHEDIVMLLGDMKNPDSIGCIKIALNHDIVEYDDVPYPLTKKCIWALGSIGTHEGIEILQSLAKSKNYLISESAKLELSKFRNV